MNPHQEHTMQCPTCTDTALVMSDRQGVEIDYCPKCRGVWLDRGELDKLIERSGAMTAVPAASGSAQSQPQFADSDYEHGRSQQGQRKKSWLSNIFD
jgi:Zn-finger nucleic acid-binding protein